MATRKSTVKRATRTSAKRSAKQHEPSAKAASGPERILAIDVGGTGLKAAIIDAHGKMQTERLRVATPHPCTPDQLVDALVKLVEPLVEQHPPTRISIGFPGVVRNNRVLTAPHFGNEGWHDIPLAESLATAARRLAGAHDQRRRGAGLRGYRRSRDRVRADAWHGRGHGAVSRRRTDAASRTGASSGQQKRRLRRIHRRRRAHEGGQQTLESTASRR